MYAAMRHFFAACGGTGIVLLLGLLTMAAMAPVCSAQAQTAYPTRSVRVLVPFAVGGVADITVRIVVERLGEKLSQRFVVENHPGAGGIVAARAAISAPTDGYTITLLTNGTAISVKLLKSFPLDVVKDFAPISTLGYFDWILAVNAASPVRSLRDFVKTARERPGTLNVGTVSVGSSQHLTAELFKSMAGISFDIVHYRTTSDVVVALLREDVQLIVDSYAALKSSLVDEKIRALAVSGATRFEILPDSPTVQENGIADFEVSSWNGLFTPVGTPPAVIAILNQALQESLAEPELKKRLLEFGIQAKASTPEGLQSRLRADIEKWGGVIERAGIPKQ
jgi:tripartite-type tricarboxylate transporter receptor subunit TctC